MSKDQGTKRLLSPETVNSVANKEDKRRRNDSLEIDESDPSQVEIMDPKQPSMWDLQKSMDDVLRRLTLTALSEDLNKLVSKDDLKELDDRVLAQSQEIDQLRDEMKGMQTKFDRLQSNVDSHIAANLSGATRSLGRDPGRTITSMAAPGSNRSRSTGPQRRNLVIEGIRGETDMEIIANVIEMCEAIDIKVYASEIEQVTRMGRRDEANKKPGPVILTLSRIILRDSVLQKKCGLMRVEKFKEVFVNADEPLEIRKAKSFLRKACYNAKRLGEVVLFKHNMVTINGVQYGIEDVDKIPEKFMKSESCANRDNNEAPMEAAGGEPAPTTKEGLIRKGEKMRITKKGLCFSGPSSYLSNLAYISITYNKRSYDSNEQGYQWLKAIDHHDEELAKEIKATKNSFEIKSAGSIITNSDEWNLKAPDILEKLFEIKLDEHPDLLERLIETYPLDLIEASTDTTWGGGGPSTQKSTTPMTP